MALRIVCPSGDQLKEYSLGKVNDQVAEEIDNHLPECSICVQALNQLKVEDPLSKLLHESDLMKADSDPELLAKLQGRLRLAMQTTSCNDPTKASLETPVSVSPGTGPASSDERSGTHEVLDFLRPAEKSDELGRLGQYRVLKVLGVGGMGIVVMAEDTVLKRKVALKVMRPSLAKTVSLGGRILKEASRAASVKHDHIVTIHAVGQDNNTVFLAMELLEGQSLEHSLEKQGKPSLGELCRIGRQVAQGLAAAHAAGVVHRDIKPSNIWLEGPQARVKILDFGLACKDQDEAIASLQGAVVGTPAYMAPEQVSGEKIDGRADFFSLGCVLYRLATGEIPFKGKDTVSMLVAIAQTEPVPPRKLNPEVPTALSNFILQLLKKSPEDRPTSDKIEETLTRIEQGLIAPADSTKSDKPSVKTGGREEDSDSDLEKALWNTLTFASKESFGDMDDLLKHYAFSVNQLQTAHQETTAFFHVVCQTSLEFRSEGAVNEAAHDEVLKNELVPMMSLCFLAPLPADKVFTAHITDLPLERAEAKLSQELKKKTRTLVQQFLQVCEKLVDQQIMGMIEWVNPAACILYFFRKVVIQTQTGSKVVDGAKTVEVNGLTEKTSTAQTRVNEGGHEVRRARHEHHLHKAESTDIDRATTIIPLPFQPLVKAIPSWLRIQIHLVTGTQFRGKIDEALEKKGPWKNSQALPSKEEFRTLCEPAITLGRFVFAGWGDAEIEGECQREELEAHAEKARELAQATREFTVHRAIFFVILQTIASLLLSTGIVYSPSNTWVGLVVALAGLWPVWEILRFGAKTRPIRDSRWYYVYGFAAGVTGALAFLFFGAGFVTASLALGCLGIMSVAAFVIFFRQAQILRE